jgi:hypothetical protein
MHFTKEPNRQGNDDTKQDHGVQRHEAKGFHAARRGVTAFLKNAVKRERQTVKGLQLKQQQKDKRMQFRNVRLATHVVGEPGKEFWPSTVAIRTLYT